MQPQKNNIYDKLNYVPLPNLKDALKSRITTGDEQSQVDKMSKKDVIAKFKLLKLSADQIDEIYSQYRYGGQLSFQLIHSLTEINKEGILDKLKGFEFPEVPVNLPYEKLVPVKDLFFIDETSLDQNTIEIGFKYASLYRYIGTDENEEPSYIYQTRYGFLWMNTEKSYIVLISKDEKINNKILEAIQKGLGLTIATPKLSTAIINTIFPKYNVKSAAFSEPENGTTLKISFANEIVDDPNALKRLEELESTGNRKSSGRYNEKVTDSKSVISINGDKAKITVLKTFSTEEIRKWGMHKFQEISDEIKKVRITDIGGYFNIFESEYFKDKHFNTEEKDLIKLLCTGVYNAIKAKDNYQFDLGSFNFLNKKFHLKKFFTVLPFYTCSNCEMEEIAKCYHCDKPLEWDDKNKRLSCTCGQSYGESIYLKCDEKNVPAQYSINDCLTFVPNYRLIEIIKEFIGHVKENFNDKSQSFYINNSVLYFKNNNPAVEYQLNELSQLEKMNMALRYNNTSKYISLENKALAIQEKCKKKATTTDCDSCIEHPERICLMKLFKYVEPSCRLEPHKGTEYGDASFGTVLNSEESRIKIIMKSANKSKEKNITSSNSLGKDILGQVVTQYLRDAYKPILGVLATPGVDRYLKEDIVQLVKFAKGKVIFIEKEQLTCLLEFVENKGVDLSLLEVK